MEQRKWLGISIGSSSTREDAEDDFIQFAHYEPNQLVRSIIGPEASKKVKEANKYSDNLTYLICDHRTGKIELRVWIGSKKTSVFFHSSTLIQKHKEAA